MVKVVIVGGGIIGLSSALCLIRRFPDFNFTLISEKFSPNTTADGAAGICTPYLLQNTPPELVKKWFTATLDFLLKTWNTMDGGKLGVSLIPFIIAASEDYTPPEDVYGLRALSKDELRRLNFPDSRKSYSYTAFTCEPSKILPYFLQEFTQAGGHVEERRVTDLESLTKEFDIVVHCTGLGARKLASDDLVHPVRGQVCRVQAPNVFHVYFHSDHYIIPNQDSVVIGGTHQENDWNTSIDDRDTKFIASSCQKLIPSLKDSVVLRHWVGLRPGRNEVRLELEEKVSKNGKISTIIHNYGHGGSGVTLFWGCALNVVELVEEWVRKRQSSLAGLKSKL